MGSEVPVGELVNRDVCVARRQSEGVAGKEVFPEGGVEVGGC